MKKTRARFIQPLERAATRGCMTAPTVTSIVSACQAGDRVAQRRLYEEFHIQVHRLAARLVGAGDADDLCQQVFLQVFRKIGQFEGESRFATWLFRVATNECLQHLRSRSGKRAASLTSDPIAVSSTPESGVAAAEILEVALSRLDPDLRTIFILREVEELNYAELADALQISEGTVASRLSRARKQLKLLLVGLGWEP